MQRLLLSLFFLALPWIASAQETESAARGKLSGQWRSFYLATINKGELRDFHALATGGKIGYSYRLAAGLEAGAVLYTSFNTGIQDLTLPDPTTGRLSRYELGLFDVQDPADRFILFPGELYLRYQLKKHTLTLGRMKIVSPFINPEDGRMIPTLEQGLWYTYQQEKRKLELGVFNRIAPRSASGFMPVGQSIGVYPVGRHTNGRPSQYAGATGSDFIALAHLSLPIREKLRLEAWNYYTDNVFNALYLKPEYQLGGKLSIAAEWLHESRVGAGGNAVDSLRYFTDARADVLGVQLSTRAGKGKLSLGYDYILPQGRFLFPREWGREFLFSFQKRERTEGAANNHAAVLCYDRSFGTTASKWRSIISLGHHWKPPVTDAAANKYAQPDYTHVNLDLFWQSEKLKGLRPELLLTWKRGSGDFPENPNFVLNKVDMFQINMVVNYNF